MKFKKIVAALTCAAMAAPSFAGMDTLMQFTNLSPFQATVEFPKGNSDCWHNDGAQDKRIAEYFDYYRRNAVSDKSYKPYLQVYKESTGIADLAKLPLKNMDGSSATLAPAVVGSKVDTTLFRGETSAELLGGCKFATSTRGFTVHLTDNLGRRVSSQHYIIQDPPGSAWTMSQMAASGASRAKTITLGSGGQGNPWEIGFAAGLVVVTVISVGSATTEMLAGRVALMEVAEFVAAVAAEDETLAVTAPGWRAMFSYAFNRTLVNTSSATLMDIVVARRGVAAARLLYGTLAGGVLAILQHNTSGPPTALPAGSGVEAYEGMIDFASATVAANAGLPDDRSVCTYQTGTLGVTECRLVGVGLTIMPNGSLVFAPLPSVGGGD